MPPASSLVADRAARPAAAGRVRGARRPPPGRGRWSPRPAPSWTGCSAPTRWPPAVLARPRPSVWTWHRTAMTRPGLARWKRLEMLRIAGARPSRPRRLGRRGRRRWPTWPTTCARRRVDLAGVDDVWPSSAWASWAPRSSTTPATSTSCWSGDGDPRRLLDILRRCWRVDLGLRPEGRDGPRRAAAWPPTRPTGTAGPRPGSSRPCSKPGRWPATAALGDPFLDGGRHPGVEPPVRGRRAAPGAGHEAPGRGPAGPPGPASGTEFKRGPGGIRDVEFAVQLLQMVHGRADPTLRVAGAPSPASSASAPAATSPPEDAAHLGEAYRFLRTVEHRLQLREDQQVAPGPGRPYQRMQLARILGYRDDAHDTALARFDRHLRAQQAVVRPIHERLFFRPLLEAFSAGHAAVLSDEAVSERLSAFGFSDARRTRQAIAELTQGFSRTSNLLSHLLPLLLDWLSDAPDPDLGLLGLRSLTTSPHCRDQLTAVCRESPAGPVSCARCWVPRPSAVREFQRFPDALAGMIDGRSLAARSAPDLHQGAHQAIAWRTGPAERQTALQRYAGAERLRIIARDVLGLDDVAATGSALTNLAEAVLAAALEIADPQIPFAVIGMGRFGGAELAYGSDLDVLFVYDGTVAPANAGSNPGTSSGLSEGGAREAERIATTLVRAVGGETPAGRIFAVDAALRPEGRLGPLARSLEAFDAYYQRWAHVWERQALLRGRVVAGDAEVGERFTQLARQFLWGTPLDADEVRDIRRLKARMERERIPASEDPQFHLKLGRGSLSDIEWTAQLLQLRHGVVATGTVEALSELSAAGLLEATDAAFLINAYRFCEATRNRLHLVRGAPGDSLPATGAPLGTLARSLSTTPTELRDTYRRHTRRARRVVERLFYGVG